MLSILSAINFPWFGMRPDAFSDLKTWPVRKVKKLRTDHIAMFIKYKQWLPVY